MNHLIRPALYEAYHDIKNASRIEKEEELKPYTVTGYICESGDYFGRGRELNVKEGDILVIMDTGAYGYSMVINIRGNSFIRLRITTQGQGPLKY